MRPLFALLLLAVPLLAQTTPVQPFDPKDDPKEVKELSKYLEKFGGAVIRDASPQSKTRGAVLAVQFYTNDLKGVELKKLMVLPKLTRLTVNGTKNTDELLKQLADLPNVTSIGLEDSDATDDGMKAVAALPNLKALDLSRALKVTAAGYKTLAESKSLAEIDASETNASDDGIKALAGLKTLASLKLKGCPKLTLKDTGGAFAGWDKLAKLDLSETAVGDAALVPVGVAKGLTDLNLSGTAITDAGLKPLNKCTKLKVFTLDGVKGVTGKGFADLDALTDLEEVTLSGSGLTDAGLGSVARLKNVKKLDLDRTKIGDAGVKELATGRGLLDLSFEETSVGDGGLVAVADKALKLERVRARKSKVTKTGAADAMKKHAALTVDLD